MPDSVPIGSVIFSANGTSTAVGYTVDFQGGEIRVTGTTQGKVTVDLTKILPVRYAPDAPGSFVTAEPLTSVEGYIAAYITPGSVDSICFGDTNQIDGHFGVISGGGGNTISNSLDGYSTISGGLFNSVQNRAATVLGGVLNDALGAGSIAGGEGSSAGGIGAIALGILNTTTSEGNVAVGGFQNTVGGSFGVIVGGRYVTLDAYASLGAVVGGYRVQNESGGFIGPVYVARVYPGCGSGAILTGTNHTLTGPFGLILGGSGNTAFERGLVGNGKNSFALGVASTVLSGEGNTAWGAYSTVLGGAANLAREYASTVTGLRAESRVRASLTHASGQATHDLYPGARQQTIAAVISGIVDSGQTTVELLSARTPRPPSQGSTSANSGKYPGPVALTFVPGTHLVTLEASFDNRTNFACFVQKYMVNVAYDLTMTVTPFSTNAPFFAPDAASPGASGWMLRPLTGPQSSATWTVTAYAPEHTMISCAARWTEAAFRLPTAGAPMNSLCILNQSVRPDFTKSVLEQMRDAIVRQLTEHYAPFWTASAPSSVTVAMNESEVSPDAAVVAVADSDGGAGIYGYHWVTAEGKPMGVIFADTILNNGGTLMTGDNSISQTLSHEILEMMGDPFVSFWSDMGDGETEEAMELCDRIEAQSYSIDGVAVSNFLGPCAFRNGLGPYDWLGLLNSPWEIAPGGYVIRRIGGPSGDVFVEYGKGVSEARKAQIQAELHPRLVQRKIKAARKKPVKP